MIAVTGQIAVSGCAKSPWYMRRVHHRSVAALALNIRVWLHFQNIEEMAERTCTVRLYHPDRVEGVGIMDLTGAEAIL